MKRYLLLTSAILSLFLTAQEVLAAELALKTKSAQVGIDQLFQVDLIFDPQEENVNAMEGKVVFPSDLLELKEIRDGNSIINFWLERPQKPANSDQRQQEVAFSGIIPGGFSGKTGAVLSLVFQSRKAGEGLIEIKSARALRSDGLGTPATLALAQLPFSITPAAAAPPPEEIEDLDPPEIFQPLIGREPELFNGRYFLAFAAQDKKSGIDRYEVYETRQKELPAEARWIKAESPYILEDQALRSSIYVKAIDRAGNERIVTVPPPKPLPWYENYLIWGIIIIGSIVAYLIWRRKKGRV